MATIASLIVDVAANTAQLTTGVKKVNDSLDSMSGFAASATKMLAGTFTIGAVAAFAKSVFDTASDIKDMSAKIGISTDAVQGFKFAAEQTGSSLDAVGTAITRMNKGLAGGDKATVGALKDVGLNFSQIRSMKPEDAFLAIADAIGKNPDPMIRSNAALTIFGKSAAELLPGMQEGFGKLAHSVNKMSKDTIDSLEQAQDAWEELANQVTIVTGNMIGVALRGGKEISNSWKSFAAFASNAMKVGVGAAFAMAEAQESAALATKKFGDVNLALEPPLRQTKEQLDAAAAAAKRHADAIQLITDKLSGSGAIKSAKDMIEALRQTIPVAQMTQSAQEEINKTMDAAIEVYRAQGKIAPQTMRDLWMETQKAIPVTEGLGAAFASVGEKLDITLPKIFDVARLLPEVTSGISNIIGEIPKLDLGYQFGIAKQKIHDADKALGELSQAFAQMAQVASGSVRSAIQSMGTLVTSLDTAKKGVQSFKQGQEAFRNGDTLTGIMDMATGIMGIASAAIAAGKAIAGMLDRNKGRDIVTEFVGSLGGFDALHKQLNTLGDEGERLWIKLTQGVGRNNKDQARAAVEEVTAALEKHKTAQEAVGAAAVAADAAQIAAFTKAKDAVTTLDSQIKTLSDSIAGEAPEEFMGIVEQQTRARIDGLTKEREAAADTLVELGSTMVDSIKDVADAIRDLPKDIAIRLHIEKPEQGFAGGGRVLPFATGGFAPMGTDTVPAMLTPGEIVLNAAQQRNVAGGLGGLNIAAGAIVVNGAGDPEAVADAIMRKLRREKRFNAA